MPARTFLVHFSRSLLMLLCAAALANAQQKQIRVAAAADLQAVMPEIARAFETQTGSHVEVAYGSSGNFYAQIENGAPFDVFFSADSGFPQKLIQSGRAEPRSAVVYGVGGLVLWMPANAECDPQLEKWNCLLKSNIVKIAIANPAHAPYGRATIAALHAAQLYEQVRTKLVLGESIAQAAQFAQSGNAQAGILAYSLTRMPSLRGGKQWEIPRDTYPPIEQVAVVLKVAQDKSLAKEFIKFVTDGPGRELLQQAGFQPPPVPKPRERRR